MDVSVILVFIFSFTDKITQRHIGIQFVSQCGGFFVVVTAAIEPSKQCFDPIFRHCRLERRVRSHLI